MASGLVAPLTLGGDEEQLWTNCDVASLAEHRLDDATDPRELDTARLARWRARALTEPPWPPSARDHERCYWLLDQGEDRASLSIRREGSSEAVMLVAAVRTGDRLRFDEASRASDGEPLGLDAMSTLGVALALRGWPLVRSSELWDQCRVSDLGAPESLAYKITIWEAWSRKHGWRVETPSIPGLDYPTWDELEARWKAEEQAFA